MNKNKEFEIRVLYNHDDSEMEATPYFWCIIQDGANCGCGWNETGIEAFKDAETCVREY